MIQYSRNSDQYHILGTNRKNRMNLSQIYAIINHNIMELPAQLKIIEEEAFSGIVAQAIIIPDGCTTIKDKAFADCPSLLYVWIPKSVTDISEHAFDGCNQVVADYEK